MCPSHLPGLHARPWNLELGTSTPYKFYFLQKLFIEPQQLSVIFTLIIVYLCLRIYLQVPQIVDILYLGTYVERKTYSC